MFTFSTGRGSQNERKKRTRVQEEGGQVSQGREGVIKKKSHDHQYVLSRPTGYSKLWSLYIQHTCSYSSYSSSHLHIPTYLSYTQVSILYFTTSLAAWSVYLSRRLLVCVRPSIWLGMRSGWGSHKIPGLAISVSSGGRGQRGVEVAILLAHVRLR